MSPRELTAIRIRKLLAELASDRRALEQRNRELEGFAQLPLSAERTAALAVSLDRAYTTLEAILERVACTLEGELPKGEDWHRQLVADAGLVIENVRPAILSDASSTRADELRRFRYFLRHAYAARFDDKRIDEISREWLDGDAQLQSDLNAFADYLTSVALELESAPSK